MSDKSKKVIVIGAGASGLMASCTLAQRGVNAVLMDGNSSVGRKINATGNGRCNFTNVDADNVSHYHGSSKSFISGILSRFNVSDILVFFEGIGVEPMLEDDGKYFPLSGQASCVSELLERHARRLGVEILLDSRVEKLFASENGVKVISNGKVYEADGAIVACGGMAAPDTGSNGVGYELARALGHTIVPPKAVIVQLKTRNGFYKSLSGLRTKARVQLICDGRAVREEYGDLMFFDYGLSGPPIFQLSCYAVELLDKGKKVYCEIDLLPQYGVDELRSRLILRSQSMGCNTAELLVGMINKKLIKYVLQNAKEDGQKQALQMTDQDIARLVNAIKSSRAEVIGTKGWENAQATLGGILLDEVDADTLRSRLNGRVAFCGEILDVAGDCGGYNLTWAWASGYVCGSAMAEI